MIVRSLVTLTILAALGNGPLIAQQDEAVEVGPIIALQMTGELAAEYLKQTRPKEDGQVPPGLIIETTAILAQQLNDGRIRVEHTSHTACDSETPRLVTLTATVEPSKLTTDVIPKGAGLYSSPADHKSGSKPTMKTKQTKSWRLMLSNLKGVKLRTWTLTKELGD